MIGRRALLGSLPLLLVALLVPAARAGDAKPPSGKALERLVEAFLAADAAGRARLVREADATYAPLVPASLPALRKALLKAAARTGPRLGGSGTNAFFEDGRGKYIVQGRPGKVLFVGLHGGGEGAGSAESAAGAMGGGGWWWIFPEVLEKTERGWTTSGTEAFVMDLIDAAKRTGKVDPNRVYITGHSMGGFGTWHLGAHHADVFAGAAAFAGAPVPIWRSPDDHTIVGLEPGVLPSFFTLPLHVYQSLDDRNVPPEPNQFAVRELAAWKERFPDGFEFRYDEVDGRGHAAPAEGYLPALEWLATHARNPRPLAFLWQPALAWKRQFYWVHWARPEIGALLDVRAAEGNVVRIVTHEGSGDVSGLSVLLGEPLVDLGREVVVEVNGEERFRGLVPRTFSTLLLTLPRYDDGLLFDARVDL